MSRIIFGWETGKREFLTLKPLMNCAKCGIEKPWDEVFSYVDGNNKAITKNSKAYCLKCYKEVYGDDR